MCLTACDVVLSVSAHLRGGVEAGYEVEGGHGAEEGGGGGEGEGGGGGGVGVVGWEAHGAS